MGIKRQTPSAKFYLIDDVPVCVWNNGRNVSGFVVITGHPYPPLRAVSEGQEVSIDQLAMELGRA